MSKVLHQAIIFEDEDIVILSKPPGISGNQFSKVVPQKWPDASLFQPQTVPTNLHDFCVVAKNQGTLNELSEINKNKGIKRVTILVCHGKVNASDVKHSSKLIDLCTVLCEVPSNNAQDFTLSLIKVQWSPKISSEIKRIMMNLGKPVVGKGAHCKGLRLSSNKQSKGTFLTTIAITLSKERKSPVVGEVSIPKKFLTLIENEHKFWGNKTQRRKYELLQLGIEEQVAQNIASSRICLGSIIGKVKFGPIVILTHPKVFTPRPSSYALIHTAIEIITSARRGKCSFLDLGCGSGALLLAAVRECSERFIKVDGTGIDISEDAIALSLENARLNELHHVTYFRRGDYKNNGDLDGDKLYNIVLANPPYLPTGVTKTAVNMKSIPSTAVDGGQDGLEIYRSLARISRKGGYLSKRMDPEFAFLIIEIPGNDTRMHRRIQKVLCNDGLEFLGYGNLDDYRMHRCLKFKFTNDQAKKGE